MYDVLLSFRRLLEIVDLKFVDHSLLTLYEEASWPLWGCWGLAGIADGKASAFRIADGVGGAPSLHFVYKMVYKDCT